MASKAAPTQAVWSGPDWRNSHRPPCPGPDPSWIPWGRTQAVCRPSPDSASPWQGRSPVRIRPATARPVNGQEPRPSAAQETSAAESGVNSRVSMEPACRRRTRDQGWATAQNVYDSWLATASQSPLGLKRACLTAPTPGRVSMRGSASDGPSRSHTETLAFAEEPQARRFPAASNDGGNCWSGAAIRKTRGDDWGRGLRRQENDVPISLVLENHQGLAPGAHVQPCRLAGPGHRQHAHQMLGSVWRAFQGSREDPALAKDEQAIAERRQIDRLADRPHGTPRISVPGREINGEDVPLLSQKADAPRLRVPADDLSAGASRFHCSALDALRNRHHA